MEVAGPLGTPLGLAQRKRASPRGEACKELYCIITWNIWSMNQGKLEVVKQEMTLQLLILAESLKKYPDAGKD